MPILLINELLEMSNTVSLSDDQHGLCLNINTTKASAKLSFFGGHLLSFINKKDGKERLWLSDKAVFDGKTPIRGGVPICWPWFGSYASHLDACITEEFISKQEREKALVKSIHPNHGFVRSQVWQVLSIDEQDKNEIVTIKLSPQQVDLHAYTKLNLVLKVTLTDTLNMSLITTNQSEETQYISQALHSYFAVPDITNIQIEGLDGDYYDKPSDSYNNQSPSPYKINQEVDRVHANTHFEKAQSVKLYSKTSDYQQTIEQFGHNSIVVWNPWQDLSKEMRDMEDDGYRTMLCVEAANMPAISISPGMTHTLEQIIR
jgi:glucose-6-phosphate 1-epimerase